MDLISKKVFLVFFCNVMILANVPRANQAQAQGISFSDTVIDFGNLYQGAVVDNSVELANLSDQERKILDVQADCGCIVSHIAKGQVYQPLEKSSLKISLDTKGLQGKVTKQVTIFEEDSQIPIELKITANVTPEFESSRRLVRLNSQKSADDFFIKRNNKKVKVKKVTYNKKKLTVSYKQVHDGYAVKVKLKNRKNLLNRILKRKTSSKGFSSEITFHTNSKFMPAFKTQVLAQNPKKKVFLSSKELIFHKNKGSARSFFVKNSDIKKQYKVDYDFQLNGKRLSKEQSQKILQVQRINNPKIQQFRVKIKPNSKFSGKELEGVLKLSSGKQNHAIKIKAAL